MKSSKSVEIVEAFWTAVWNAHDAEAVDRFVVEDFVIVSGGQEIVGRDTFKKWVTAFLDTVDDLHLDRQEQRILGTAADQRDITMTGTAVWAVREDGKLLCNWVERASWELVQRLNVN